ncbi:MAG: ABC transporter permease [Chloroflexi bacterium]|nr:ABC transporter permease [Chloroflexota bacterium]
MRICLAKFRGAERLLGTDSQGRDVLAVLVYSTPQTLLMGVIAGVVGIGIGTVLGLLAGFFGGWIDLVIRTLTDVFITIPGIAILIVIATNVRQMDVATMSLIVASLAWRFPARAIRAQTLSLRERGYIQIARLSGVSGLARVSRSAAQPAHVHRRRLCRLGLTGDPRDHRLGGARTGATR